MDVVVLGARGFVGAAVCTELTAQGWAVHPLVAPRIRTDCKDVAEVLLAAAAHAGVLANLVSAVHGADAVVNAAGLPTPTGMDRARLTGANAVMPALVAQACTKASVRRFVHVSSAAVQGTRAPLDEMPTFELGSAYARVKALGEQGIAAAMVTRPASSAVILRPTSVHGPQRSLTRSLARLARSPLATVMAPGDAPTPQVLVENVAAAVAYLCNLTRQPPPVVLQPWEGWTTRSFLRLLGGHEPRQVPTLLARTVLCPARRLGTREPFYAYRRRLELLWCGQAQVAGWLSHQGFVPPAAKDSWERLAAKVAGGIPS